MNIGVAGHSVKYIIPNESAWLDVCEGYDKVSPSKFGNVSVRRGDRVRLKSGGGGGFGPVAERSRALVDEDVAEGFVSAEAAAAHYGFAAPAAE